MVGWISWIFYFLFMCFVILNFRMIVSVNYSEANMFYSEANMLYSEANNQHNSANLSVASLLLTCVSLTF